MTTLNVKRPDDVLTSMRTAAEVFRGQIGNADADHIAAAGALLALAFDVLDAHMSNGGEPPADWLR